MFFFLTYGSLEFCGWGLELGFWCWGLGPVVLGFLSFLGDVALFIIWNINPGNRNGATGMLCQQIGRKHPLNNPIDLINYNMEYCYIREAHPVCHQQVSVILSI